MILLRRGEEVIERKLRAKAEGLLGEVEAEILWAGVSA